MTVDDNPFSTDVYSTVHFIKCNQHLKNSLHTQHSEKQSLKPLLRNIDTKNVPIMVLTKILKTQRYAINNVIEKLRLWLLTRPIVAVSLFFLFPPLVIKIPKARTKKNLTSKDWMARHLVLLTDQLSQSVALRAMPQQNKDRSDTVKVKK